MLSIENYLLEYQRKIPNILFLWMMILTFIIISLVIINQTVTIKNYYSKEALIKDKNVSIYVLLKDLDKVVDNNYLYVKNKKYSYKIKEIGNEIITDNTSFYKEVILSVNIDNRVLIDNNIIEVGFIVKEMTIFEYIIDLIKGE